MASFNQITILGYLGKNPEVNHTQGGTAVCNFSIATTEKVGDKDITTWFACACFGKRGETILEYFSKGDQILINGRMHASEWENRDGETVCQHKVLVNDWSFVGKKGEDREDDDRPRKNKKSSSGKKRGEDYEESVKIPF